MIILFFLYVIENGNDRPSIPRLFSRQKGLCKWVMCKAMSVFKKEREKEKEEFEGEVITKRHGSKHLGSIFGGFI